MPKVQYTLVNLMGVLVTGRVFIPEYVLLDDTLYVAVPTLYEGSEG